jgi:hypothetical protein
VQSRFGGEATAFADSAAGATGRLGEDAHVLAETFGEALIPEVEAVSSHLANYLSNADNLARVQKDVAETGKVVATVASGIGHAFEIAKGPTEAVAGALGGFGKVAELAFGAVVLTKVIKLTKATLGLFTTTVAGEEAATAATTAYTGALIANTGALEANAAASTLRLGGLGTATGGFGAAGGAASAGTEIATVGEEAATASVAVRGLTFAGGALRSVLAGNAGIAAGAVIAGYELSTLIRKIPGWNSAFESLGSHIAGVFGAGGGRNEGSSGTPSAAAFIDSQTKLVEAYKKALEAAPPDGATTPGSRGALANAGPNRDALVASLAGAGFNFHDAQVAAAAWANRIVQQGNDLVTKTLALFLNSSAAKGPLGPSADSVAALALQQALATKTTADEEAIYKARAAFLTKEIDRLQAQQHLTTAQTKTLAAFYKERTSYEQQIQGIEDQAASDRASAAQKAAQQRAKELAARKAELAAANQAYRSGLSIEEQKLQIQVQRAGLTDKSLADDRKADQALLRFYQREAHDKKLTEAERLQYQSQAIQTQLTLKQLKSGGAAGGATVADIFGEAASEFKSFGSNIAGRGGILSGQDARASFAARVLNSSTAQGVAEALARQQAQQAREALSESQKQTALLKVIARGVGRYGTPKATADAIRLARRTAKVGGG